MLMLQHQHQHTLLRCLRQSYKRYNRYYQHKQQYQYQHQCRSISLLHKKHTNTNTNTTNTTTAEYACQYQQKDLDHAIQIIQKHDPAGYLPGWLLPTNNNSMKLAYFAVRAFWIETGLRFTAVTSTTSKASFPADSSSEDAATARLRWWEHQVKDMMMMMMKKTNEDNNQEQNIHKHEWQWQQQPTLRLLHHVIQETTKNDISINANANANNNIDNKEQLLYSYLLNVLQGRKNDINIKQYSTLQSLEEHALLSCGSLFQFTLLAGSGNDNHNILPETHPITFQAAKYIGIGHGLTNALRTSIPVLSTTGKLIVLQDLCDQYQVKSPRYLLSALGQGDKVAHETLAKAIQAIVDRARHNFQQARHLRQDILTKEQCPRALPVFLPALASETFLQRLERANYNLTDRNHLRNVSYTEHAQCAMRMVWAYYQKKY